MIFFCLTCIRSFSSFDADLSSKDDVNEIHMDAGIYRPRRSRTLIRKSHPFATSLGCWLSASNNFSKLDLDKICWARTKGVDVPSVSLVVDLFSGSLFVENGLNPDDSRIKDQYYNKNKILCEMKTTDEARNRFVAFPSEEFPSRSP